jgi:hypothetical protein
VKSNYVSKPTAGDGLQSFRLLPAGSGLTLMRTLFASLIIIGSNSALAACPEQEIREVVFALETCQPIALRSSPSRIGLGHGNSQHQPGLVVQGTLVSGRPAVDAPSRHFSVERQFYFVAGKAADVCPVKLDGLVRLTPIARCCDAVPFGHDCISAIPPATIRSIVDEI